MIKIYDKVEGWKRTKRNKNIELAFRKSFYEEFGKTKLITGFWISWWCRNGGKYPAIAY